MPTHLPSLIFASLVLSSTLSHAKVISTNTITPIEKTLHDADKDTLVITDVEGVLYTPVDQILQPQHKKILKKLQKEIEGRIGKKEAYKLYGTILKTRKDRPANKKLPHLIKSLQKKGVRVIALTSCGTNSFGAIPAVDIWSINKLESMGYNLNQSWRGFKVEQFSSFQPPKHKNSTPTFKRGILFTCGVDKGEVLKAFIKKHDLEFSKIIFIDDKMPNVSSVEKVSQDLGLTFEGFYYTESQSWDSSPLNLKRAKLQLIHLEKENRWLSDKEVEQDMGNEAAYSPQPRT